MHNTLHSFQSCAFLVQFLPATLTRSSVQRIGCLPTLLYPSLGLHSSNLLYFSYCLRYIVVDLQPTLAMSIKFILSPDLCVL